MLENVFRLEASLGSGTPRLLDAARCAEDGMTGKAVAHYQIVEKLGEGGMGSVWKAWDNHLDRFVALKFLPPAFSSDRSRTQRFVQEAKAASALQHVNIITVHDVGESEGTPFIVLEYVRGKTLDALIGRKGLKPSLALRYAVQIADALAKAHAAGIVHRDLKPSNVMVSDEGVVKVLDFGLAKVAETEADKISITKTLETQKGPLTDVGVIVGTLAYMSPEQVEGKPVDARTDMFSFGSVLYEMLSGQRAFDGGSSAGTIAAILEREPRPLRDVVPNLPLELERIVARCLRKDRERRVQDMRDLRILLEDVRDQLDSGSLRVADLPSRGKPKQKRTVLAVLAALLLVSLSAWYGLGQSRSPRMAKTVPVTTYPGLEIDPALSPDGRQVAFAWNGTSSRFRLYVKLVDAGTPLDLSTEPGDYLRPAWSPDGRFIAFLRRPAGAQNPGVFVIPSLGGPERKIADLHVNFGFGGHLSWSPDGRWLATSDVSRAGVSSIILLSLDTGQTRQLTSTPRDVSIGDINPVFSPDGRTLAFLRMLGPWTADLYLLPLTSELQLAGEPKRLTFDNRDITGLDWTPSGNELIFASNRNGRAHLWRIPRTGGSPALLSVGAEDVQWLSVARQVTNGIVRLVYAKGSADTNLWSVRRNGDEPPQQLIASTQDDYHPQYSPDGSRIGFASKRSGFEEIWVANSDGSRPTQLTSFNGPVTGCPRWSPDGKWIAFDSRAVGGRSDIYVIDSQGGAPRRLTEAPSDEVRPSWSRDGQFIYFATNSTGHWQIAKISVQGGAVRQVTRNGGREAFESFDGRYLYYRKAESRGIWRSLLDGSDEALLTPHGDQGKWVVFPDGVSIFRTDANPPHIEFFRFDTNGTELVKILPYSVGFRGFAVPPDQQSFLFQRVDLTDSDIMMVDNFR
jgi:Tol biopolymer transport system component